MQIKFKKLDSRAVAPIRAHKSDAGFDLTATQISTEINECGQLILVYHTGLAVEIPEGYFGVLLPRSSVYKKSMTLTNSAGVIDSGYRGEIMGKFRVTTDVVPSVYKEGERFAQLLILPVPEAEFIEAVELSDSERGEGGYGSTDINQDETSAPRSDSSDKKKTKKQRVVKKNPVSGSGEADGLEQA